MSGRGGTRPNVLQTGRDTNTDDRRSAFDALKGHG